jgi:hypothetical protein
MRNRRSAKSQWGQTGRQRQAFTPSGAPPFREEGRGRMRRIGHVFHAGLHRTVLELDRAEALTRAFLLRRAKSGDAFAARLLRDRYRLRVATVAEVHQENQQRALNTPRGEAGVGPPEEPAPVGGVLESR